MKIDSPKSIFNPACAEKISIFSAHAGCALPGASGSLRASSLSAQDFKPTIQAGGLAAYSPLGWFIRPAVKPQSPGCIRDGVGGWNGLFVSCIMLE